MDYNYVEGIIKENIKNKCPQLPNEIIEEYLNFTFFRAAWVNYGNNKDLYIVGIAENKHDFYYVGFDNDYKVELISSSLQIKRNKDRDNDYIAKFDKDNWQEEYDCIWKIIRNNIKIYFDKNINDKLIYFEDRICSDEHIVFDNEDHTEWHIEKIKNE
jgi:hypothetical protein